MPFLIESYFEREVRVSVNSFIHFIKYQVNGIKFKVELKELFRDFKLYEIDQYVGIIDNNFHKAKY